MSLIYINPYAFSTPWTPAQITTALWLDAADSSNITVASGVVSEWKDKSGNARHLSQSTSALRPTYDATGFNSLPTVKALASSQQSLSTNENVSGLSGGSSLWAIAVGTMESTTNTFGRLLAFVDTTSGARDFEWPTNASMVLRNGTTNAILGYRNNNAMSSRSISLNTPAIIGSVFNGTNHITYIDGTGAASVSSTGVFATQARLSIFWNHEPGVSYWSGKCSELIMADATLTTTNRELIEGYLAHKWGLASNLPAAHPYKTTAPTI